VNSASPAVLGATQKAGIDAELAAQLADFRKQAGTRLADQKLEVEKTAARELDDLIAKLKAHQIKETTTLQSAIDSTIAALTQEKKAAERNLDASRAAASSAAKQEQFEAQSNDLETEHATKLGEQRTRLAAELDAQANKQRAQATQQLETEIAALQKQVGAPFVCANDHPFGGARSAVYLPFQLTRGRAQRCRIRRPYPPQSRSAMPLWQMQSERMARRSPQHSKTTIPPLQACRVNTLTR
jgi:hypothetical protein